MDFGIFAANYIRDLGVACLQICKLAGDFKRQNTSCLEFNKKTLIVVAADNIIIVSMCKMWPISFFLGTKGR